MEPSAYPNMNGKRAQGRTICDCPYEVLNLILSYTGPHDIRAIGSTCRKLRSASQNEDLWRRWAVLELRSWSNWRLASALDPGETCRDFVLKCLAFEDWYWKEVVGNKRHRLASWAKHSVATVCNKYAAGTLNRLALCYTPQGALFWWGRVSPPADVWDLDTFSDIARKRSDSGLERYHLYTGEISSGRSWQYSQSSYRLRALTWDGETCAFRGFSWRDGSDAAELYVLCRHFLAIDLLSDVWDGITAAGAHKWDALDMWDAKEALLEAADDVKSNHKRVNYHLRISAAVERTILSEGTSKELSEAVNQLFQHYMKTDGWSNLGRREASASLHVLRDIATYTSIKIEPCSIPHGAIRVTTNDGRQFVIDFRRKSVVDTSECPTLIPDVTAISEQFYNVLPANYGSDALIRFVLQQVRSDAESSRTWRLDDELEVPRHYGSDNKVEQEYGHFETPIASPGTSQSQAPNDLPEISEVFMDRVSVGESVPNVTNIVDLRKAINKLYRTPLAGYVLRNNLPISGLRPERDSHFGSRVGFIMQLKEPYDHGSTNALDHLGKKSYWFRDDRSVLAVESGYHLFTGGDVPEQVYYFKAMDGEEGYLPLSVLDGRFECQWDLDPADYPTAYGTFLELGETFSRLSNRRFLTHYTEDHFLEAK